MKAAAVFLVLTLGSLACAADPVAEFAANFPLMTRGTFTARVRKQPDTPKTTHSENVYVVTMDPPRWKIISSGKGVEMQKGKLTTSYLKAESVTPAVGYAVINVDVAKNVCTSGVAAYTKPLKPDIAKTAGFDLHSLVIDGRIMFNDYQPLPKILSLSDTKVSNEVLNNVGTVVITATGKWGKHVLWLDPARNYVPLRVVQEKGPDDLIDDAKPLRSLSRDPYEKPPITYARYVQQFDATRVEKIGGRFVVTGFTRRAESTRSDKSESGTTETITITDVKPVEKWDTDPFVFSAKIPDGTPVTAQDDMPIEYEWRGGKIVKKVNAAAVAAVEAVEFKPPAAWNVVNVLLFAAATVGIGGIGYLIWRRASGRGSRP